MQLAQHVLRSIVGIGEPHAAPVHLLDRARLVVGDRGNLAPAVPAEHARELHQHLIEGRVSAAVGGDAKLSAEEGTRMVAEELVVVEGDEAVPRMAHHGEPERSLALGRDKFGAHVPATQHIGKPSDVAQVIVAVGAAPPGVADADLVGHVVEPGGATHLRHEAGEEMAPLKQEVAALHLVASGARHRHARAVVHLRSALLKSAASQETNCGSIGAGVLPTLSQDDPS